MRKILQINCKLTDKKDFTFKRRRFSGQPDGIFTKNYKKNLLVIGCVIDLEAATGRLLNSRSHHQLITFISSKIKYYLTREWFSNLMTI